MIPKPITVARRDYMKGIVDLTNNSGLPTFVVVEVLEKTLKELRPLMDIELKREEAFYREALIKETDGNASNTDNNEKE